jgi:hypothetical protein
MISLISQEKPGQFAFSMIGRKIGEDWGNEVSGSFSTYFHGNT